MSDRKELKAKRTAKNSVFLDLFKDKKYLLELYRTLHPEDTDASEDTLTDVTIENVLTDNLYNDLGFIAGGRLMILVEAQSTWTVNILVRIFLYLAESYREYIGRTGQNLYGSKRVKIPKPELYVIYTGNRFDKLSGSKADILSFSEEFFDGADAGLEIKVKVISESGKGDIISQYIMFCKVFNEQTGRYGMTGQAVAETIRICKDRNVLKDYLERRETEVVTIMKRLFDEEEIMEIFWRSKRYEAEQEAFREAAITMIKSEKIALEDVTEYFPKLSEDSVQAIEAEVMQLA